MKLIICPKCRKGRIEQVVIPQYCTQFGGSELIVENASIAKCSNINCGFISVSAKEIKRWEEQQKSNLNDNFNGK